MSFSNDVKREVCKQKLNTKLEALLELSSILKVNASISIRNAFININFITESEFVAKRIYYLIDFLYEYECVISRMENNSIMKSGVYSLSVENEEIVNKIIADSGLDMFGGYSSPVNAVYSRIVSMDEKSVAAYLRGVFLGSGSIVDPNKSYNLEIILTTKEDETIVLKIFEYLKFEVLNKKRKEKRIIYIKNSETISSFLNLIGATSSMLDLENIKVEKDVKNNINRRMNFELANINRTIESALDQIRAIEILEENNQLPEDLIEISNYRKKYPEYSLQQIAELFTPPLAKSSVAYKMNKIKKLSENIKNKV